MQRRTLEIGSRLTRFSMAKLKTRSSASRTRRPPGCLRSFQLGAGRQYLVGEIVHRRFDAFFTSGDLSGVELSCGEARSCGCCECEVLRLMTLAAIRVLEAGGIVRLRNGAVAVARLHAKETGGGFDGLALMDPPAVWIDRVPALRTVGGVRSLPARTQVKVPGSQLAVQSGNDVLDRRHRENLNQLRSADIFRGRGARALKLGIIDQEANFLRQR